MCFWFWKWQKWLWQKWQGLPQPVFDTVCANLVIFLCFITSWYSVWKLKIWALFSIKSEQTIAKSCFLLYLCRRKTCTRQFESRTFIALVCIFFAKEKPALMLPRGRLLRPREVTIDDRRRSSIMPPKGVEKSPRMMEA